MKLSVIIPIYNVEPFVARCIASLMRQDTSGCSVECIVVDDCGQDRSMDIVRQTIAQGETEVQFSIVSHDQNRGLSAARNTGLAAATGDYILFVDSDDYLMPGSLQCFARQQQAHPEADILIGNVQNGARGGTIPSKIYQPLLINDREAIMHYTLGRKIYLHAWNKVIRRTVLTGNGITFIEGIVYEDEPWSYRLMSCAGSVLLLPDVTYFYECDNASSIVSTTFAPDKIDRVLYSYMISCCDILDRPPRDMAWKTRIETEHLLYVGNILTRAADILQHHITPGNIARYDTVRRRMLNDAWSLRRVLLWLFFLCLFYVPGRHLQRWRWFRRHYYGLERMVGIVCHHFDCLHQ